MAQDAPVKISDDFRQHLYEDELAFFDLAGLSANDAPNANVMYELGLRHAFGYPSVLFAWDGARESEKREKQGQRGDDSSAEDAREKGDDDQP
jgi:hypothetical protein